MDDQYDALELTKLAEKLGISEEELDEYVHEQKAKEASDINNSGLRAQIDYLVRYNGAAWTKETLRQISGI